MAGRFSLLDFLNERSGSHGGPESYTSPEAMAQDYNRALRGHHLDDSQYQWYGGQPPSWYTSQVDQAHQQRVLDSMKKGNYDIDPSEDEGRFMGYPSSGGENLPGYDSESALQGFQRARTKRGF